MGMLARCVVCGDRGRVLCGGCAAGLPRAPAVPAPQGVESVRCVFAYRDGGGSVVRAIKYGSDRRLACVVVPALAVLVEGVPIDEITWVPWSTARRRHGGRDPTRVLAGRLASRVGVRRRRLLRRRPGPTQTGASREQRLVGPGLDPVGTPGRRVLLVDDVVTTGATIRAAAAVLRSAGAESVHVVALAHTP